MRCLARPGGRPSSRPGERAVHGGGGNAPRPASRAGGRARLDRSRLAARPRSRAERTHSDTAHGGTKGWSAPACHPAQRLAPKPCHRRHCPTLSLFSRQQTTRSLDSPRPRVARPAIRAETTPEEGDSKNSQLHASRIERRHWRGLSRLAAWPEVHAEGLDPDAASDRNNELPTASNADRNSRWQP